MAEPTYSQLLVKSWIDGGMERQAAVDLYNEIRAIKITEESEL